MGVSEIKETGAKAPTTIQDIAVYNPMSDGLDYQEYQKRYWAAHERSPQGAYAINDGLYDKVLASVVGNGMTLEDFLFGKGGYLTKDPEGTAVIFVNGRFHSEYHGAANYCLIDLELLNKEANRIHFMFSWLPEANTRA